MSGWRLPESLNIGGSDFFIRTDYRDILTIIQALNDPDLPEEGKAYVLVQILYKDEIPEEYVQEAVEKGIDFIGHGANENDKPSPKLMDWEQDVDIIIPAINKAAGVIDIRAIDHMHWWTFLGYYMEIGDSLFSQVLNIRYKRAHGKKLEKWERDFEKENKNLIRIKPKKTEEELQREEAEKQALKELLGEV